MGETSIRLADGSVVEDFQIKGDAVSGTRVLATGQKVRFWTSKANWDEISGENARRAEVLRRASVTPLTL
jgi:hypothetical protein